MGKQLQLTIPTPCHENWDAMSAVDKGKFCGSCQKQVVDFTSMSDRQVAEFFKKPSTGSVCGRFMTDQLDRNIEVPKKRIPWVKYFFQFALPAFLLSIKSTSAKAQGKVFVKDSKVTLKKELEANSELIGDTVLMQNVVVNAIKRDNALRIGKVMNKSSILPLQSIQPIFTKSLDTDTLKVECSPEINIGAALQGRVGEVAFVSEAKDTIYGNVIDETGFSIPGASIKIKGLRGGVVANNFGDFSIKANVGDVLLVLGAGLMPTEIVINKKKGMQIVVKKAITGSVTEVIIVGAIRKANKKDKVIRWFKESLVNSNQSNIKVFPNPITAGSSVTIETKQLKEGNYSSQLYNQSGQSLQEKEIWIDEKATSFIFDVPTIVSGTYFLVLINKKTGKKYSEKIIIQ